MVLDSQFKIEKPAYEKEGLLTPQPVDDPIAMDANINQDWGKGDLKIGDQGSFYTPPSQENTVASNLEGLLSSGSSYLESARANAAQTANQRGLLNSTMAATAGEQAAIQSALPIAQQDAQFGQQKELAAQQGDIQERLYQTQGDISERLAQAGYQHEQVMKDIDMSWNQIDLDARMQVEYDRMKDDVKNEFNEISNLISEDYMDDYIEIMLNPNFRTAADRQQAFDILSENTRSRYEMAGAVSEVELTWPGVPVLEPDNSVAEKDKAATADTRKDEISEAKKKADERKARYDHNI